MIHRRMLGHPNIVPLLSFVCSPASVDLIMPYCSGGDLLDAVKPEIGLPFDVVHPYAVQIFCAIAALHQFGYAHRCASHHLAAKFLR